MKLASLALAATMACRITPVTAQPPVPERLTVSRLRPQPGAFDTNSGLGDSTRLVVHDTSSWRALWQRINAPFFPQPALPSVDFDREMIVVAALGAKPTGGYDIMIEGAAEDSATVEISVLQSSPGTGCALTAARTQPVDLARIPARRKPVRFRERRVVVPCGGL
jgi:hypothetical protein